jgi:hypothetical protein
LKSGTPAINPEHSLLFGMMIGGQTNEFEKWHVALYGVQLLNTFTKKQPRSMGFLQLMYRNFESHKYLES